MPNRNVNTEVWNDDKFTDDFTAEDKYFWLFLLTTRYGNLSGCFKITYNQIAKDMGYSKETAENLIYRFTRNYGLISYDKSTSELVIHNWYKYNWSKSPKAEASIKRYLSNIKSDFLRNMVLEMYENYKNGDRVSIGYQYSSNTNTISNTNSIPITITKEDTNINDKFNIFWKAYPKKKSKGAAEKAFNKLKPNDELLGTILSAIELQKGTKSWKDENGKYIPYPATWLNAKGWEDEIETNVLPKMEDRW